MDTGKKAVHEAHQAAVAAEKKVQRGGKLYFKVRDAHINNTALPTAQTLAVALPGDEVIWLGASEQNPLFHKVRFTVQRMIRLRNVKLNPPIGTVIEGYTFGANLSVNKPDMGIRSKDPMTPMSPEAFPSFGVGIKA